jgi:hypothetical protein
VCAQVETEGGAKKAKDCDNVAGERRRGADSRGGRHRLSRGINVLGSLLAASKKAKLWLGEIHDLFLMCPLLKGGDYKIIKNEL